MRALLAQSMNSRIRTQAGSQVHTRSVRRHRASVQIMCTGAADAAPPQVIPNSAQAHVR
eukprot:CAMPEP_0183556972 /NCGR_PEP_ID=MMETSP0371-20130417/84024_1 /TAXON_ID=268820 /ORGANISM="Peridinium aciculiferum, Strain PAER-2" /LENGTH=58 /DNA_ID=CAMNT_0025763745 /DNA_START=1 /DNA_END=174 /DNA_ORIENTATION=+